MKIAVLFTALLFSVSVFASKVEVEVLGMTCAMCIESITKELKSTEKVENINVNLDDRRATFDEVKGKKISDGEVRAVIKRAGYEAQKIRRY